LNGTVRLDFGALIPRRMKWELLMGGRPFGRMHLYYETSHLSVQEKVCP